MDPTGAVIVGATVTATNTASGLAVSQPSNAAGRYRILGLQPGIYQCGRYRRTEFLPVAAHVESIIELFR